MELFTQIAADAAVDNLKNFSECAAQESARTIDQADLSKAISFFDEFRERVRELQKLTSDLQKQVDALSYELIPKMFMNNNVKTMTVPGVGRATVAIRWSARMLNKVRAFNWLRSTGNEGLIIETVNSQTLGAFAKEQTLTGKPLPSDVFQVSSAPFVSITKSGIASEGEFLGRWPNTSVNRDGDDA
jgi:hypothetical protein